MSHLILIKAEKKFKSVLSIFLLGKRKDVCFDDFWKMMESRILQGGKGPYPPLPQPQLQTSQEIFTFSIKISLMSDSCAEFRQPE